MSFRKYKSNDIFISKCKEVHGNKYDYSDVVFTGLRNEVSVGCKKHGLFNIVAYRFIAGHGCYKCGRDIAKYKQRKSNITFIKDIETLFGKDFWDLSKVDYINNRKKVVIGCKVHGDFLISPTKLLDGQGCPKCRYIKYSKSRTMKLSEFIKRAENRWGSIYDYSKVNYVNSRVKVEIVCPKHGSFFQAPNKHLSGDGCPICSGSKGERLIKEFLDKNNIPYKTQVTFKDCRDKSLLRFDFSVLKADGSIDFLIEFQGQQHFKPYNLFGGLVGFESQKRRDSIKLNYCKKNSLTLRYIDYRTSIISQLKKLFGTSWKY